MAVLCSLELKLLSAVHIQLPAKVGCGAVFRLCRYQFLGLSASVCILLLLCLEPSRTTYIQVLPCLAQLGLHDCCCCCCEHKLYVIKLQQVCP